MQSVYMPNSIRSAVKYVNQNKRILADSEPEKNTNELATSLGGEGEPLPVRSIPVQWTGSCAPAPGSLRYSRERQYAREME